MSNIFTVAIIGEPRRKSGFISCRCTSPFDPNYSDSPLKIFTLVRGFSFREGRHNYASMPCSLTNIKKPIFQNT